MAGRKKAPKEPKVKEAVLTEDGCLLVTLNEKVFPHTADVLFTPDLLLALTQEYGQIPPLESNDFPGVPVVDFDSVFSEGEEIPERDGSAKEKD